jgi:hypothetical protein
MQILKVKNITEFESAEVPADSLLVFPERQTDGSYLWRCKDSENNSGTIGTGVESVNGKTGPNVVLEHADLGAVAENLSSEYGRPDTLLAQMMFFIRNGAVNLYGTLGDLKNFMGGYFANASHNHTVSEITDFEDAVEPKLDKELLVPTTAIYIDGNRTDSYTEDGSPAYPYKTIAAATAAHQEPASYFIAKGTYAESAEINLYANSVVYGAYSTVSGAAANIGEGCYVHNLVFCNTVNVAVNGNTPMFHYCRFMGATMNLVGSTDFDGCYISSSTTFNSTIAASGSLRAFNSSINTAISAACRMYFNDCAFSVSSSDYAVTSTGGLLSMVACLVYNTSTGGGISCNNGANGISTYNFLVSVATNKDIACGTAVSIIGGDVQYASLTGAAVVFPSRIQAALDSKQTNAAAYNLGAALTGAISMDIANGDAQYGTLSGETTLAYGAISNLEEGQGFILQLDNAAAQTFTFTAETAGSITILDSGNTGIYKTAFSKVNGKICYDGKSEVYC